MGSWMLQEDYKRDKQFWEYRYICDKVMFDINLNVQGK